MALPEAGLYSRYRHLLPELIKFGVVGGIGSVIDLGGAAVLHGKYHVGPLESKAVSTAVATLVTYLGSRFWTFKDRENHSLRREAVLFVLLNVAGLIIAEAVIAFVTYVMGLHGQLEYNASSVLGTGLATIFRYLAYRKWVFTAPAEQSFALGMSPDLARFPDYPPWELDPAYLAAASAESAAHAQAPAYAQAPTYSSPWQPAAEQRSWEPAAAPHQPWMDNQVTLPNERVPTRPLATQSSTGPSLTVADSGQVEPLAGPRGRHRKP
jgi:putative flippase GtrA